MKSEKPFWLPLTAVALLTIALAACQETQPKGQGPPTIDLASQRPALTLFGARAQDRLSAVASGDVNGDGHPDIIVGAFAADGPDAGRPDAGEAYVIFGPPDGRKSIDLAAAQPDVTILGADVGDSLGFALAAADVNGDGIDDILVGAPLADGPNNQRPNAGEAYVIFGSPSLPETIDIALGQQDLTIFGAEEDDRLGAALASGDANGDARADILVGAFLADGPQNARYQGGEAYLVLGSPSLSGTRDVALGEYDLAVIAADDDDQLGHYLAMGDLNGDGLDDLILAAFRADGPDNAREDSGEVYVLSGSPSLGGALDLASSPPNIVVSAADAGDDLGGAVASGDGNGDGIADLLIGAPRADGPNNTRDGAGEAYVIFGSPSLAGTFDIAQGQQAVTILGGEAGDRLGAALASGDVNGDGTADIILGAEAADGRRNAKRDAGEVYVVLGSPALSPTLDTAQNDQSATLLGAQSGDVLGVSVAAPDWDGGGRDDLLAAAAAAAGPDGTRKDAGAAYLIPIVP
ncbi:MAG: hypothetical protein Q8P22_06915 [Chloroflexota bacterium]|nr:hypothetical protein [Chloroflexota bacterium]